MTDETTPIEETAPVEEAPVETTEPTEESAPAEENTDVAETAPEPVTVHAGFVIIINRDGSLSTTVITPAGVKPIIAERAATVYDVLQASKEVVSDIEGQVLADRVAKRVLAAITPVDEDAEAKARIAQALADRKAE
jgi:hypothetical protein